MTTPYDVGQIIRTTVTFVDFNGSAMDPTTVTFKYREPDGTITTAVYPAAGVTKSGTGVYYGTVTLDAEGSWWTRWEGVGAVVAATEAPVQVRASMFV